MYTLEKNNTTPLCLLCMLMPEMIPFLNLTLVIHGMKDPPPGVVDKRGKKSSNGSKHCSEKVSKNALPSGKEI